MEKPSADFSSELRLPLQWVAGTLAVGGWLLAVTVDPRLDSTSQFRLVLIGTLIFATAVMAWRLDNRSGRASRWLMIGLAIVSIILVNRQWQFPGFLALLAFPAALAAPLISLPAMWAVATAETLLLTAGVVLGLATPEAAFTALIGIWSIACTVFAIIGPVRRLASWTWEYFQRVQEQLEQARDQKVQLEQALEDLVQANQQLTRLNNVAQGLRQAAEDARIVKEQFVANVSHELRTPLNMITGFSEMILQAPETYGSRIPPALLADLTVIQRNASHLSNLIDDVLDLSQIEADQMALSRENASFEEIAEEAVTSVRPLYELKGLYLKTDVPGDLPSLLCDRTRVQEVLLNLLSNAGRFTEHGGVELRAARDDSSILVSVSDTGPGIAQGDIDKLFQPFQQLDGSLRRRHAGTGLGLSISKRFIELHGGKIWVESSLGSGTTFWFRLPLQTPVDDINASGPSRWLNADWEYVQRTRPFTAPRPPVYPRLVVLDDSGRSLQRMLMRHLDGVEVVPVSTPAEARNELAQSPAKALVINGPSIEETLHSLDAAAILPENVPAIVCSLPDLRQASERLGVYDLLVKPISRDMLREALERLQLAQGTILIVDDEPDALHLFGRIIASFDADYRVLLARDGQEAMDILDDCRPDLILLDLVMPNMDGFQFLNKRQLDPRLLDIPVLVISARDPSGGPIVSKGIAITRKGGFSTQELLAHIRSVVKGGSTPPSTGQAFVEDPPD